MSELLQSGLPVERNSQSSGH